VGPISAGRLLWTADVDVVVGAQITEVDLADAGMTVVRQDDLLDAGTVAWLEGLPKRDRSVQLGLISRDHVPGLAQAITRGILERLRELLEVNAIDEARVLSVKRDAVFLTGVPPGRVQLPSGSVFRLKNTYTAFARLGREVELYGVPRRGTWDLKGVPEARRPLHADHSVRFVLDVLGLLEAGRAGEAAETVQAFRDDYAARRLPLGFYRELNAESRFCLRLGGGNEYRVSTLPSGTDKADLDIMGNFKAVLLPLIRALA
jgi:hypothetical protein